MIALGTLLSVSGLGSATATDMVGVAHPQRAQHQWVMHCQGCHGVNADGTPGGAPRMAGRVARFLHAQQGRAFLARVPGVAFVELSDRDVAQLLNWLVQYFDPGHVPKDFQPYTADEVRILRQEPLISRALEERQQIMRALQ